MRRVASRYIYRPTWWYQKLFDDSLAPHHLKNVGGHERFLRSRLGDDLCDVGVVENEVDQLLRGDIPIFQGPPVRVRRELTEVEYNAAITTLRYREGN